MASAGEYNRLPPKQYPPRARRETAEGKFWRKFGAPELVQCAGAVTHLEYCAAAPHSLAATSSIRVQLFDGRTRKLRRTVGRFSDIAYSGSLRGDGKLMVAGGERPVVQVFDANSRSVLRKLTGHTAAVRCARFGPGPAAAHVLSASDDRTCGWWDVGAGERVVTLEGHEDYVRCAACLPGGGDVWATGGYDHTVRLWDVRAASQGPTMRLLHTHPVEALVALPSGGVAVSAAGPNLYVWDLLSGGKLLRKIAAHQKTITCLAYAPLAGAAEEHAAGPRILSGGLDGAARVHELDTWGVTHSARYPAPVTSLALNPPASQMAAGLADGTLVIRRRREGGPGGAGALVGGEGAANGSKAGGKKKPKKGNRGIRLTAANFRYFLRGRQAKAGAADYKVLARRRARLAPYDKHLRRFRHGEALDAALATGRPEVVAAVLEELAARGAVESAVAGKDEVAAGELLAFLARFTARPRFAPSFLGAAAAAAECYGAVAAASPACAEALRLLRERVNQEVRAQMELLELQGMVETLLTGSLAR